MVEPAVPGPPLRILHVEDEQRDREFVARSLAGQGPPVELRQCCDAEEAEAELARGAFDLVILDLTLPGKGGRALLAEIRGRPATRDVPVVVLTNFKFDADWSLPGHHRDAYINKPLGADDYAATVRSLAEFARDLRAQPKVKPPAGAASRERELAGADGQP